MGTRNNLQKQISRAARKAAKEAGGQDGSRDKKREAKDRRASLKRGRPIGSAAPEITNG